jgi:hypothetical protein
VKFLARLLDERDLICHLRLLLPFCFLFPLLIGQALPYCDPVQGAPFRFHSHVRIAGEHGARDVPGDS